MTTKKELAELFFYDQETGEFRFATTRGSKKAGDVCGSSRPDGYLSVWMSGRSHLAHRLAWLYVTGSLPNGPIDHINGIRSDNRIANLRLADTRKNNQNIRAPKRNNKLGILGVSTPNPNSKKPYVARIRDMGVLKNIGFFETPEAAHEAYLIEKRRVHEFCEI